MCERFKMKKLTPDMFKCLILVQGFTANKDVEIHARILISGPDFNPEDSCRGVPKNGKLTSGHKENWREGFLTSTSMSIGME